MYFSSILSPKETFKIKAVALEILSFFTIYGTLFNLVQLLNFTCLGQWNKKQALITF